MVGLGVLATGSGAAALTGATLSNTVSPTADFRVNVDTADLIVKRGPSFGSGDQSVSTGLGDNPDGSATYVDGPASTGLDGKTAFTAAANTETNSSLDFGALIPFDDIPTSTNAAVRTSASGDVEYRFPDLLQIDNKDTAAGKDIVLQYANSISNGAAQSPNGYVTTGTDEAVDGTADFTNALVSADTGTSQLSYDEVAYAYGFEFDNTTSGQERISPNGAYGSGLDTGNQFQLPSTAMSLPQATDPTTPASAALDFVVRLNDTIGDKIASFVSNEGLDTNGGAIRLVDTIYVAETDAPSTDTSSTNAVTPTAL